MNSPFSDWLKIDLHIHTDWSKKTKENDYDGSFDVNTLRSKLKECKVGLFSLTDHNIINIDAYTEYYKTYVPREEPLLLVGVELDIVAGADAKTYHTLIIFNRSSIEDAQYVHDQLEKKYKELGLNIKERVLSIDDLIGLFYEDDFFFIPHADSNKSIIKPYKDNIRDAQKMIILMQSAMEKVKEQKRYYYNKQFDNVLTKEFQEKQDHAYLEFSDNHCIQSYPYSSNGWDCDEHVFYYVKGGKSFETLRQAFIDPLSRIKSTEQYKLIRHSPKYLESIRIDGIDFIEDTELLFSPHLNVIIGGRSTGKSLLMTLIAQKIDAIRNKPRHLYQIDLDKIDIKAQQDANYCKETSIAGDLVTYVQQGEIVSYFEKRNLQELVSNTGKLSEYESSKEHFMEQGRELDSLVENVVNAYDSCHIQSNETFVLHQSTIDHVLAAHFTFQWDESIASKKRDTIEDIEHDKDILESLLSNIDDFKKCSIFKISREDLLVTEAFENLVRSKAIIVGNKELNSSRKDSFIVSVQTIIDTTNSKLSQDSRLRHEALQDLSKVVKQASLKFQKMRNLKTKSSNLASFKCSIHRELELHDGIRLVLELKNSDIEDLTSLIIDGIKHGQESKSLYLNFCALLQGNASIKHYDDTSKESLHKKIIKQMEEIRQLFNEPADHLDYGDGDTSLNKSPGYNSEKYLQIVLKNDNTAIILIDQPEDNLGNAFIADRLVDMVRMMKFNKQIFLVTHNPSVVVHGDAENVLVCTNKNNMLKYSQMTIEDNGAQKTICKILDGGEYIFHTRSRKYNIQKLMRGSGND